MTENGNFMTVYDVYKNQWGEKKYHSKVLLKLNLKFLLLSQI